MQVIRRAEPSDLDEILGVYRAAKAEMVRSGNAGQWPEGYPGCMLEEDLALRRLYVLCGGDGAVHGAFVLALGEDETYLHIEDGAWGAELPYGTIHRLGSDGAVRGVFARCLEYCRGVCPYLRADTHRDNAAMLHLLEKHGFVRRGIIYVYDGTPRIAYDYFA